MRTQESGPSPLPLGGFRNSLSLVPSCRGSWSLTLSSSLRRGESGPPEPSSFEDKGIHPQPRFSENPSHQFSSPGIQTSQPLCDRRNQSYSPLTEDPKIQTSLSENPATTLVPGPSRGEPSIPELQSPPPRIQGPGGPPSAGTQAPASTCSGAADASPTQSPEDAPSSSSPAPPKLRSEPQAVTPLPARPRSRCHARPGRPAGPQPPPSPAPKAAPPRPTWARLRAARRARGDRAVLAHWHPGSGHASPAQRAPLRRGPARAGCAAPSGCGPGGEAAGSERGRGPLRHRTWTAQQPSQEHVKRRSLGPARRRGPKLREEAGLPLRVPLDTISGSLEAGPRASVPVRM